MPDSRQPQQELMAQVLALAASDPDFRQQLLADPKPSILKAFGIPIPDHLRIRFIEKDADLDALVVLPSLRRANGELTDSDLESVTGGRTERFDRDLWSPVL